MNLMTNKQVVLDIETNGFLRDVTKIWCAVFTLVDTQQQKVFTCDSKVNTIKESYLFLEKLIAKGYTIVGHNIAFDLGVYYKLYGFDMFKYIKQIRCTYILSALLFPKHKLHNHSLNNKLGKYEHVASWRESASLKAWGLRLGCHKGDFNDFSKLSKEMVEYCKQDTLTTVALLNYLDKQEYKPSLTTQQVEIYNSFIASSQTIYGWKINVVKLNEMMKELEGEIIKIDMQLSGCFVPLLVDDSDSKYRAVMRDAILFYNSYEKKDVVSFYELIHTPSLHEEALCDFMRDNERPAPLEEQLKHLTNTLADTFKHRKSSVWIDVDIKTTPRSILASITCPVSYYKNGKPKTKKLTTFREVNNVFQRKVIITHTGLSTAVKVETFKPNSRPSILHFMKLKYNYEPTDYTEKLSPKLDAGTFEKLPYKEAKLLAKRFKLSKKLSEAKTLANNIKGDKIHCSVNVVGTNTYRTTTTSPNLAQINKKGGFRELFLPHDDMKMLGADMSGAEIVLHGEFLLPYDNGRMRDLKATGDVHQNNADLMEIDRDSGKPVYFGSCYGASDTKIGSMVYEPHKLDPNTVSESEIEATIKKLTKRCEYLKDGTEIFPLAKDHKVILTKDIVFMTIYGNRIQTKLKEGIVGFLAMEKDLHKRYHKRGWLKGLDGRRIYLKSPHSALNYLLQSSNAIFMKYWIVLINTHLQKKGYILGKDYYSLISVYDEYQVCYRPDIEEDIKEAYITAMRKANKRLLKSTMELDISVGDNWGETH